MCNGAALPLGGAYAIPNWWMAKSRSREVKARVRSQGYGLDKYGPIKAYLVCVQSTTGLEQLAATRPVTSIHCKYRDLARCVCDAVNLLDTTTHVTTAIPARQQMCAGPTFV